jgi:hypothetical protein
MLINYQVKTRHKHSVRVTPMAFEQDEPQAEMTLPDIYVTHDLLGELDIKPSSDFKLSVTFEKL